MADVPVHATVSDTELDADSVEDAVLDDAHGAVVTFRGIVRNHDGGRTVRLLEYQAHPDAADFLANCCTEIESRCGVRAAAEHRTGSLVIGDVALVASVSAAHRAEAFAACADLVDLIKTRVPIWKRQVFDDGASEWVGL